MIDWARARWADDSYPVAILTCLMIRFPILIRKYWSHWMIKPWPDLVSNPPNNQFKIINLKTHRLQFICLTLLLHPSKSVHLIQLTAISKWYLNNLIPIIERKRGKWLVYSSHLPLCHIYCGRIRNARTRSTMGCRVALQSSAPFYSVHRNNKRLVRWTLTNPLYCALESTMRIDRPYFF